MTDLIAQFLRRQDLPGDKRQRIEDVHAVLQIIAPSLPLADLLGCYVQQPTLLNLLPERIQDNVDRSATLLGLSKAQFVAAAAKQPQLFCQKPETLNGKKPYLLWLADAVSDPRPFSQLVMDVPTGLTYSTAYLHARHVLACNGLGPKAYSSLIVMPSTKAEALVTEFFTAKIASTGRGARALQVMHAAGLIKALPSSIPPIQRPPSRRALSPG